LGELDKSVEELEEALRSVSESGDLQDLHALLLTNLALIFSKQNYSEKAIRSCRQAIEVAGVIYSHHSFDYLQHVRVLVLLFLKTSEYHKAEVILEENDFSKDGISLLKAYLDN
jgi:tetratricopeptide (TPR) repeat protein